MSFQTFIDNITPKNTSQVSVSGEEIRSTIENKSSIISSSFLTGSYVRHTKIHPIDDLDIFFKINFSNTHIFNGSNGIQIYISSENIENHPLKDYTVYSYGTYYISPIKLINHIGKIVRETYVTTNEQYRDGECYTVYLSSKGLTIDCVPYAGVTNEDYMLIPTKGNDLYWKKTNPATDKDRINTLDKIYDGKLKGVIKILKYWNKNKNTGVKFRSYLLECIIYQAFIQDCNSTMGYLDLLKKTVDYIKSNVKFFRSIEDIPGYESLTYILTTEQINRIVGKLDDFSGKLSIGEYTTIDYLKS